jgi:hypothetical protein
MKLHLIRILWTGKPNSGNRSSGAQIGRLGARLKNGTIPDDGRNKMKSNWIFCVAAGVILLACNLSHAANHYICAGASGANDGTSWANAFTDIPATLVRGDTYYIAGGNYNSGTHTFNTPASGSTYIYLKKANVNDNGGDAGFSMAFATNQAIFTSTSGPVWVIHMVNLSVDGVTGSGTNGYGIKLNETSTASDSCCTIYSYATAPDGLIVKHVECALPDPSGNYSGGSSSSEYNIYPQIWPGPSPMLLQSNYIHGGIGTVILNGTSNVIDHCYLARTGGQGHSDMVAIPNGQNVTIKYCVFENLMDPSTTYIEPQVNGGDVPNGIYIYGNIFRATSAGEGTENPSVFSSTSHEQVLNVYIYNNTIYGLHASPPSEGMSDTGVYCSTNTSTITVRNNIWQACVYDPGMDCAANDHNLLNTGGASFVNAAAGNFHLVANTTAGVNLGSPYNIDPDGNTRTTWSLGAYEYGTISTNPVISVSPNGINFGSVLTNTVSSQTFVVQNTGGGTLTGTATVSGPFSIVAGGTYSLNANQSQNVTVGFSPTAPGPVTNTVTFTGGGGMTETLSGTGITNYPAPQVSAITQSGSDVDSGTPGVQVFAGSTEQYSGSASDPSGLPLSWQWIYTVNGGSEIVFQSGTGTVASAGNTCVWKLRVSNGFATAESDLTIGVEAPPVVGGGLAFPATSGALTAPFVATNGYISQAVNTDVTDGGQAVYSFTITNAGNYVIQASVDATSLTGNSFYVNIDAQPQDPSMIWDINPVTSGFEQRLVSWRGSGLAEADQFVPEIFNLTAGTHQLIIVGREPGTELQSLSILKLPPSPLNLHIVSL